MKADGLLKLYRLANTVPKGLMPREKLVYLSDEYFEERMVGYNRQYAALGVDQKVDALVRIWRNDQVMVNDYAVLDDNQYRIDFIQHLSDEDGLPVTDLTLSRLGENYDVLTSEAGGTIYPVS